VRSDAAHVGGPTCVRYKAPNQRYDVHAERCNCHGFSPITGLVFDQRLTQIALESPDTVSDTRTEHPNPRPAAAKLVYLLAQGTPSAEGYGTRPVERAQFIVDTIRIHLVREACMWHRDDLSSIGAALGVQARWCPACGTRLLAR
jgi:hypothetical protein